MKNQEPIMVGIFNQNDWLLLIRMIAAHLMAEWLVRLTFWKSCKFFQKHIHVAQLIQGAAAGVIIYVLAGSWGSVWLIIFIFISRVGMDMLKYKDESRSVILLSILKQIFYLLVIALCWIGLVGISTSEIGKILNSVISNVRLWIVGLAYLIIIWPAGLFIGQITVPWRKELEKSFLEESESEHPGDKMKEQTGKGLSFLKGLEKSGLWVGRLERILILTFVLIDKYDAIGFLITAKILRFTAMKGSSDRKEAEYVLIGTMMSFVIAILVGIFANWILNQLKP